MNWNLFIDDERNPLDVTWGSRQNQFLYRDVDWIIARDWPEVRLLLLTLGMPTRISFDHDLGEETLTGYDIAKKLVDYSIDMPDKLSFPEGFTYLVHSRNPVGADNIRFYLDGYLKSIEGK